MKKSLCHFVFATSLVLCAFVAMAVAQDTPTSDAKGSFLNPFVQQALRTNDKNGDGKVTKDEAVNQLKKHFDNVDADGDGEVTADELAVLAKRMQGRRLTEKTGNRAPAQHVVPDEVIFQADIAYRDGSKKWKLDLARPKAASAELWPAIVFVHGGGWRSGDKGGGQWRGLPLEYASRGYVCVSVNYRLTDEGTVLDCIADCKCAVRWLRAHAAEYNVDPDRIGAYGNSAGAHLVAILGLAPADAKLDGDGPFPDQPSHVQAVCCSATPADFMSWGKKNASAEAALSRLFGESDIEQVKRRASPVTYATEKAPPFLVIHGTADTTVRIAQGDALDRALREAGAKDVTYMKIKDAGHGVFMQHGKKTRPAMKDFFDRVLR